MITFLYVILIAIAAFWALVILTVIMQVPYLLAFSSVMDGRQPPRASFRDYNKKGRLDTITGIKIYAYLTSVEPIDIYFRVRITCNDNLYLTNI